MHINYRRLGVLILGLAVVLGACSSAVVVGRQVILRAKPIPVTVRVVDPQGVTVPSAAVVLGDLSTSPGRPVDLYRSRFPVTVQVSATGYHPATTELVEPPEGDVEMVLDPVVVAGRVVDEAGVGLAEATVTLGAVTTVTDRSGAFALGPAVEGDISVFKPAWLPGEAVWDGSAQEDLEIELRPRVVRAMHAIMALPAQAAWEPFLDLASRTEINGVVLDVKDESGYISHASEVPLAREMDAVFGSYDLTDAVTELHDRGLYVIGRVVTFEDPVAAEAKTSLAIKNGSGAYHKGGQAFLDPTDPETREYAIDLGVEACEAGMDEIQFDYVRFPTGLKASMQLDGEGPFVGSDGERPRLDAIASFLAQARETLHPLGCAVSADIFAIVLSTPNDQGIGQSPEEISASVDVLSPMIYPDHYADGWIGFDKPRDHPGAVVDNAMAAGVPRLAPGSIMRPWIADFNYGASSVRAEIDAVEKYGSGWMLWNPGSRHTEGALNPGN